jgi:hypothetical protein
MSPKDHPAAHFEVDDPAAAFRRFQDAARKVLSAPKKAADKKPTKPKSARR